MKEIIKFGKPGCAPCVMVDKFLKEAGVEFKTINPMEASSDEDLKLIIDNSVRTIPVTILMDEGKTVARKAGYNEKALQQLVDLYNE